MGSNIEPEINIPRAIPRLNELGTILRISSVYQSVAIGSTPQADYLNAAVLLETGLGQEQIREVLRSIEADHGRVRTADKYAARTIDLDLCILGNTVLATEQLTLPDPEMLTRMHIAVPIAELMPDFRHPLTGERLGDIASRLQAGGGLRRREDIERLISPS